MLIWSNEPINTMVEPTFRWSRFQPVAHVMNLYTIDVFLNNFTFQTLSSVVGLPIKGNLPFKSWEHCPPSGKAKIVGVMEYVGNPKRRIVRGVNRDLNWLRMAFLQEGWKLRRVDIFGADWPDGMSKGDSRRLPAWHEHKLELLREYDICLAVENTTYDYYCTEKIWQSLAGGCLPIFTGGEIGSMKLFHVTRSLMPPIFKTSNRYTLTSIRCLKRNISSAITSV